MSEVQWLPGYVTYPSGREPVAVQVPIVLAATSLEGWAMHHLVVIEADGDVVLYSGSVVLLDDEPTRYWRSAVAAARKLLTPEKP